MSRKSPFAVHYINGATGHHHVATFAEMMPAIVLYSFLVKFNRMPHGYYTATDNGCIDDIDQGWEHKMFKQNGILVNNYVNRVGNYPISYSNR